MGGEGVSACACANTWAAPSRLVAAWWGEGGQREADAGWVWQDWPLLTRMRMVRDGNGYYTCSEGKRGGKKRLDGGEASLSSLSFVTMKLRDVH